MNLKRKVSVNEISLIAGAVLILIILGSVFGWLYARSTVVKNEKASMIQVADIARSGLPYFFETGKNLIGQKSDFNLSAVPAEFRSGFLAQIGQSIPFFQQILLVDEQGNYLAGYPEQDQAHFSLSSEDLARVHYLANGQVTQIYVVAPADGSRSGLVTFMNAIRNGQNDLRGILIGRTDLSINPQSKPFVQAFDTFIGMNGKGIILDEYQRIIYSADSTALLKEFKTTPYKMDGFTVAPGMDGKKSLVYVFSIPGQQWMGLLSVPYATIGFTAFLTEIPFIFGLLLISGLLLYLYIYFFRRFERPIKTLADRAGQIAQGKSEVTFGVNSNQQVRELDHSLENMRKNLNDRIQELTLLNQIPLPATPEKDLEASLSPFLSTALHFNADAARLVLMPEIGIKPDQTERFIFLAGGTAEIYTYLDDQVVDQVRNQNLLILPNTSRIKQLKFLPGYLQPGAVVALPITLNASQLAGVLILLFDQPRNFAKAEIQFYSELLEKLVAFLNLIRERNKGSIRNGLVEHIVETSEDPILVANSRGEVLLRNAAAMRIEGMVSDYHPGLKIDNPQLTKLLRNPDSGPSTEIEIQSKDGTVYQVDSKSIDRIDGLDARILILRDRSLEKQRSELQSDFISIVSHDLRSPLTLAKGYVNMLEMVGSLNDQQRNFVSKISNSIDHMSNLTSNLLDLERFEVMGGINLQQVDPREIVDNVMITLEPLANQKNIQFQQIAAWELIGMIEGDPILLNQAVYNLVENALKFTPVGGKVTLETKLEEPYLNFVVKDNGVGIAPIDLPRIFQKAYRPTHREPNQTKGPGLGLAIVKSIAERHHGQVQVESQLGKGTEFTLRIPIRQSEPGQ